MHLVLRTGARPLSELMRRLNTGYARSFNLRHGRSGYVFQDRFRSILVGDDAYLQVLIRYVYRNPLEAGLVESLDALASYPWCGHAALLGRGPRRFEAVEEVRARFGGRRREEARARAVVGWLALHEIGCTLGDASRATGVTAGPMSRSLKRGRELAARLPQALPPAPPTASSDG